MTKKQIAHDVNTELECAMSRYTSFHSNHEGFAVIKEEVDELWDLIKQDKGIVATDEMRKECIQIAAMSIRFILDLHE